MITMKTIMNQNQYMIVTQVSFILSVFNGNLADLKLKNIIGPRLGAKLIVNKNGLIFPMCSSMTLRRPQMALDSRYCQEEKKKF